MPATRPRRLPIALGLGAIVLSMLACAMPIPVVAPPVTPCASNCPPPSRSVATPHVLALAGFSVTYYSPWSVAQQTSSGVVLAAGTALGDVNVLLRSQSTANGTSAGSLLTASENQYLSPDQYSGIQDTGPVNGAEIGYVPGAGETYSATTDQANAPNIPVYLEFEASVRGTTGIVFLAVSPLDPNSPDPSGVPNAAYDQLINSVQWT